MANACRTCYKQAKRYALQIALEIIKGKKSEFSFTNEHILRGHQQEPMARMPYKIERNVDVTNSGFFDLSNYGESPDGLVENDSVIETKSVTAAVHFATMQRGSFEPAYKWQLVGHLDYTCMDWADFVSYCSDVYENKQFIIHRLQRRDCEEEISVLRTRLDDFIHLIDETMCIIRLG